MALQKPPPRYWDPEELGKCPHIYERARTSTTLWIKQRVCRSCLRTLANFGELLRTERVDSNPRGCYPHTISSRGDQPDSATSPHALRRSTILKADEPGTCSMLHKPTALGCRAIRQLELGSPLNPASLDSIHLQQTGKPRWKTRTSASK